MEGINMINKDKILSPWTKFETFTCHKKRSFIEKIFNREPKTVIKYGFKRELINGNHFSFPLYHVFEQNNEWTANINNRFNKYYKNSNDAMNYTDEILIKEGYYLVNDWERFEKLKLLI